MPEVSISTALDDFISLRDALLLENCAESKCATNSRERKIVSHIVFCYKVCGKR